MFLIARFAVKSVFTRHNIVTASQRMIIGLDRITRTKNFLKEERKEKPDAVKLTTEY